MQQGVILKVIDAHLTLYGQFNRSEIVDLTGVGIASVSRAMKAYKGKCSYIGENKRYEADKDFSTQYPSLDHFRYLRACKIVFAQEPENKG